ncbi:hypothetical protein [Chryseobacterium polytrichastri]|uniref:Uncharacterized protein n=1 Tax=Chryseobacterium polytrichastri TaxID=1302687 RepID=A0A1M7F8X9_9FLAO|nr:hypothetical protein [Chryseobacterium polytrichastri]SHM00440.1 hypothetical protein SAMN05444267_10319 [Chryseobacterium polytrichastri]
MKTVFTFVLILGINMFLSAQKVDYKNNIIAVDGNKIGKVEVQKQNFGLTKNFNLYSIDGEKLIIAVLSTEFEGDKNDNTSMYYRFTFLPTNQVGIFKLSTLGMEKGFVNLIGKGGIIDGNTLNANKVTELIASKGVSPRTAVNYTLVARNRNWPIELRENKSIEQGETIGFFNYTGSMGSQDAYEFFIPGGIMVAKVSFAGGNNAQNFELFTASDKVRRVVPIPQKDKVTSLSSSIDPNLLTLKRITAWLVQNNYL